MLNDKRSEEPSAQATTYGGCQPVATDVVDLVSTDCWYHQLHVRQTALKRVVGSTVVRLRVVLVHLVLQLVDLLGSKQRVAGAWISRTEQGEQLFGTEGHAC